MSGTDLYKNWAIKIWWGIGIIALLGVFFYLLELLKPDLIPFIYAIALVYIFRAPVDWLEEKKLPRALAVLTVYLAAFLVILLEAYHEDGDRVVLKLNPRLAPYKVAVFPLLANRSQIVKKAREVFEKIKNSNEFRFLKVAWDERGNIGKRYYSQDEIGTPYCITIDNQTLQDETVTIRNRDTMQQERLPIHQVFNYIQKNTSITELLKRLG